MVLLFGQYAVVHEGGTAPYAWAPSDKAIKGRNDQSLSAAGSAPSSVPNHVSISGPLEDRQPSPTVCGEEDLPGMVEADHAH